VTPCEFPHDFSAWQMVFLVALYVVAFFGGMAVLAMLQRAPILDPQEQPECDPSSLQSINCASGGHSFRNKTPGTMRSTPNTTGVRPRKQWRG
jgi:hypothetical protein